MVSEHVQMTIFQFLSGCYLYGKRYLMVDGEDFQFLSGCYEADTVVLVSATFPGFQFLSGCYAAKAEWEVKALRPFNSFQDATVAANLVADQQLSTFNSFQDAT